MNTRMFPGMPESDRIMYDSWFYTMLRDTDKSTQRINAKAVTTGRRCVCEFKKNLKTSTLLTDLLVLSANYWLKKYRFLPESIKEKMERYFDKDNFDY